MNDDSEKLFQALARVYFCKTPAKLDVFLQGEKRVLSFISKQDSVTAAEISRKLRMTPARIAGIMRSLEKKNYIKRETDCSDKRVMNVRVTESGRAFVAKGTGELKDTLGQLTGLMGSEKTRLLTEALGYYADAAEEMDRIKKI